MTVQAALKIRSIPIFPLRAVVYFIISIVLVAGMLLVLDRVLIPVAQEMGDLSTAAWKADNARINANNSLKIKASADDPVWRSALFDPRTGLGLGLAENLTGAGRPGGGLASHRILIMGDSYVWGDGYSNMNDLWWRALQRELMRRGYGDVEVIGAGLCGWSTRDQLEAMPQVWSEVKPDLIIWGFVTNDPDEKMVKLEAAPAPSRPGAGNLKSELEAARTSKVQETSDDPSVAFSYDEWLTKIYQERSLSKYQQTLEAVAEFDEVHHVPAFMMTLPTFPGDEVYQKFYAVVGPMAQKAGLKWCDILPDFCRAYPRTPAGLFAGNVLHWGINPANGHPGAAATHFYAVWAADYLEKHYPDSLGPRSGRAVSSLYSAHPVINDHLPANLEIARIDVGDQPTWQIVVPPDDDPLMVSQPLPEPTVMVSFALPVRLKELRITGEKGRGELARTQVWATWWDPAQGYDDGDRLYPLPIKEGQEAQWIIRRNEFAQNVNTLRIRAEFNSGVKAEDRVILLSLTPVE